LGPYAWQKEAHRGKESREVAFGDFLGELGVTPEVRFRSRTPYQRYDQDEIPPYLKDENLKALSRTSDVFLSIEKEKNMSYKLPKAKATAGRVLAHASMTFEALYQKHFPMIWKIGITHCAVFHWYHKPYDMPTQLRNTSTCTLSLHPQALLGQPFSKQRSLTSTAVPRPCSPWGRRDKESKACRNQRR